MAKTQWTFRFGLNCSFKATLHMAETQKLMMSWVTLIFYLSSHRPHRPGKVNHNFNNMLERWNDSVHQTLQYRHAPCLFPLQNPSAYLRMLFLRPSRDLKMSMITMLWMLINTLHSRTDYQQVLAAPCQVFELCYRIVAMATPWLFHSSHVSLN